MSAVEWEASVVYGAGPWREVRLRERGGQERAQVYRFDDQDPLVWTVPTSALAERRLQQEYGGEHVVVSLVAE